MSSVESIIEQLKGLTPREIADFAARLREVVPAQEATLPLEQRRARLRALAGSISNEEAEAMLAAIEHEFERVNGASE